MFEFLLALLLGLTIGLLIYAVVSRALSKSPPGPIGLPGLGILHITMWRQATNKRHRLFLQLQEMRQKYGDILSFKMGTQEFFLISGYEAIREAFVTNADKFIGRGNTNFHQFLFKGSGIIGSEGALWQEHRRFAIRVLKSFGFGRNASEQQIQEEAATVVSFLRQRDGQRIDPKSILDPPVANVVTRFIFSNVSSYEDPKFKEYLEKLATLNSQSLVELLTALYRVIPVEAALTVSPANRKRFEAITWIEDASRIQIDNIRVKYNVMDESTNYVEAYLKEQHNRGKDVGTFTDFQLVKSIWDMLLAGVDTTSNSLRWCLVYAALYPELQDKCHAEIIAAIGKRPVALKDKKELHYCQAFLDEVQRIATLAPTAAEHRAQQDTEFRGYKISSNAIIFTNLYGLHHDEKIFPEPNRFNPDRFLTPEGQYKPSEFFMQFGIGKRMCLGEVLARMEMFIFFVTYMQHFRFLPDSWSEEQTEGILLGTEGIIHAPLDHLLIVECRDSVK